VVGSRRPSERRPLAPPREKSFEITRLFESWREKCRHLDLMEIIGKWLEEPGTIWILAAILFLIAFVSAVCFELELLRLARRLKLANGVIDEEFKGADSPKDFHYASASVVEAFGGDRSLSREWMAYSKGVRRIHGELLSSGPAEQYFNPTRTFQRHAILHYRAIPGILVGLALVFTFLGIAVVIHQASNLKSSEELPRLLAPAALKFWTSLIGVFLSLVCAFHYRLRIRNVSESMTVFARKLSSAVPMIGIVHLFQEISALRSEIGRPAEDAIQEIVDHATATFDTAIEKAHGAVQKSAELLVRQTEDLRLEFNKITNEVSQSCDVLSGATNGFSRAIQELTGSLRVGMEVAVSSYSDILGTSSEKLKVELKEAANAFEISLNGASTTLRHEMEKAGTAVSGSFGDLTGKMREDFIQVGKDADRVKRGFKAAALDAEKAGESLQNICVATDGLTEFGKQLNELKGLAASLMTVQATLQNTAVSLSSLWNGYVNRLEHLDKQLAGSLSELPKSFQQYADSVGSYTRDLDQHLDTSLKGVMAWVQRIEEIQRAGQNSARLP
jgi:hypothetical protein